MEKLSFNEFLKYNFTQIGDFWIKIDDGMAFQDKSRYSLEEIKLIYKEYKSQNRK